MAAPYWFPAKAHGWGWGTPSNWQGWATAAMYVAAITAIGVLLPPTRRPYAFALSMASCAGLFFALLMWKGEPPAWR